MHDKEILELLRNNEQIVFEAGTEEYCILHVLSSLHTFKSIHIPIDCIKRQLRVLFKENPRKAINIAWDIHVKRYAAGFISEDHYENIN